MENKEAFLLYKSFYEPIKELSLEEKGQLLDAIFQYQINPDNPVGSLGSTVKIAFSFVLNQFRLDNEKYQRVVDRNRENGKKGGRPSLEKDSKKTQWVSEKPKKPDNGNEKVNVKEKDISTNVATPVASTNIEISSKDELNPLIGMFSKVNPSFKMLYANKSERKALERMVKEHGVEKVKKSIASLPEVYGKQYAPVITTPAQLEKKMGAYIAFLNKQQTPSVPGIAYMPQEL